MSTTRSLCIPVLASVAILFSMASMGCKQSPQASAPTPAQKAAQAPKREPIYFLRGNSSLSPGALVKLRSWAETWGTQGTWILACPTGPDASYYLMEPRILAIRTELINLGVKQVQSKLVPQDSQMPYDPIYIEMDPVAAKVVYRERRLPNWMMRSTVPPPPVRTTVVAAKKKTGKVVGKKPVPKPKAQPKLASATPTE